MEVRFENVYKRYGDFTAVNNLNLTIEKGALHFLLGPSGCGKTTSLRMLAGLESVSEGRLFFDGQDVTKLASADRGIGMVFQNYALWPHMSVRENIEYGLKLKKLDRQEINRRIDEVLHFTQLTNFVSRLPGQLSGGQQQRVALARALAIRPNVLLLDEPLSNLDAKLRMEMRDNILRIHKQTGITTVYVTHDQKEALSMGTMISVMHGGKLIQTDTPRQLYQRPQSPFIAGFIGETNFLKGRIKERPDDGKTWHVETPWGVFVSASSVKDWQVGDEVSLSIRPEMVLVDWDGSLKMDNEVTLTLEHLTYLGESEQFLLQGPDQVRMKANFYHAPDHDFVDGSQVRCGFHPKDVLVLPLQQTMGPAT
jgi:ABC-type Fe3+/spermidine/putrescine transport system ATPase subunit